MIITEEEQETVVEKYRNSYPANFDKILGFKDGMQAVWKLLAEKNKAEKEQKEHLEKLHKHYDEKYNCKKIKK